MAEYGRVRLARAAVCATALLTPLALSGCQSGTSAHIGPIGASVVSTASPSAPDSLSPSPTDTVPSSNPATTTPSTPPTPTAAATTAANATAGTRLTIFDGSSTVLMDGKAVDFGTEVHDLAWSPDGTKAAIIDAGGNLVVVNADGSGKVEVAKNPGKDKWTHPTWQVVAADTTNQILAKDNIFFAADHGGVKTLMGVVATAHDGVPKAISLGGYSGRGSVPPPTTGNLWPNTSGATASIVYEHDQGTAQDVYIRDDNLRQQGGKLFSGSEPALIVVGGTGNATKEVVLVRVVGGHKHIVREDPYGATGGVSTKSTDLTPSLAVDATAPTWSPDGKSVAFSTPTGVEVVNADGSGKIAQVTATPGIPVYRPGS